MSTATVDLRIVRELDPSKLSKEAIEYFNKYEDGALYVDTDRARDYVWTDEIIAATVGFCIADPDGEILADGFGSVAEAELAKSRAKVSFRLELDAQDED